jgi:hypothetical protein
LNAFRAALCSVALSLGAAPLAGQHQAHAPAASDTAASGAHAMWTTELGAGWRLLGMAQAFPVVTFAAPGEGGSPLNDTAFYLTQPAIMANVESPGARVTLRTTLNFEGLTQEDGELTFGAWGEGFIDKRHPHTLLHELMVSVNGWDVLGGAASLSAGKGFAPYGTDDPMARPGLKYPTNHHLSQILERWTVSGAFARTGWSVEAGVFAGNEPEGPYDLGNMGGFGKSWSARVAKRWGPGSAPITAWEASASYGRVVEEHDDAEEKTGLWNVALRHDRTYGFGDVYGLLEYSRSEPDHGDGYFSALLEAQLTRGIHQPYLRVEHATRPEYPRDGAPGTAAFFRYDHDVEPIGATRWTILNAGYNLLPTRGVLSVRPFVNAQFHRAASERGPATLTPDLLFGADTFWSVSLGARVFLGGDPMRMGAYGVLDPMTAMNRALPAGPMRMDGTGRDGH